MRRDAMQENPMFRLSPLLGHRKRVGAGQLDVVDSNTRPSSQEADQRVCPSNNFFFKILFCDKCYFKICYRYKKSFLFLLFSHNHFIPILIPPKEKKNCLVKNCPIAFRRLLINY